MDFRELPEAGWGDAAKAWHDRWTAYVSKSLSEKDLIDWDPERPWIQAFGDTPVSFEVTADRLHAVRDPEWGFDRIDFEWNGSEWIDVANH